MLTNLYLIKQKLNFIAYIYKNEEVPKVNELQKININDLNWTLLISLVLFFTIILLMLIPKFASTNLGMTKELLIFLSIFFTNKNRFHKE